MHHCSATPLLSTLSEPHVRTLMTNSPLHELVTRKSLCCIRAVRRVPCRDRMVVFSYRHGLSVEFIVLARPLAPTRRDSNIPLFKEEEMAVVT